MLISVLVPTMRVGGLDILFASLAAQTNQNFELVLIDSMYERRKDIVQEKARDRFLRCVHVGLKPSPFPIASFCAMSNAGIVASSGEILLFVVDYSRLPPDLVAQHAAFHAADPTRRKGMMGPHRYAPLDVGREFPSYARADIDKYEDDVHAGALDKFMWTLAPHGAGGHITEAGGHEVHGGGRAPADADPKLRMPAGPIDASFFHAKNESVHRERVIEIGGWDTDLDGAHVYQDSDFADRLSVKAGVTWTLDPSCVVEIVNPRHVFPFARQLRPHESNYEIWQRKKAAGYPSKSELTKVKVEAQLPVNWMNIANGRAIAEHNAKLAKKPLRLAMIYGEFSTAIHGPFDIAGLYKNTGLTGSESSFFNLARTLAERGHEVAVFCVTPTEVDHESGFRALPIQLLASLHRLEKLDAVIAWNEPDYLQYAPKGVQRLCAQQLNDWGYCRHPQWRAMVDTFVFPSENSRLHHVKDEGLTEANYPRVGRVIPNSVDLGLFSSGPVGARHPHRVVYCSSPDRGLHHLLALWPEVRKRVPDAELKIFYRIGPWLEMCRNNPDEVGNRARLIEKAIPALVSQGVQCVGPVPNEQMARELLQARVLAYPSDPVRYTEGFGCSVLDAAAGGCIPLISEADALPSAHAGGAIVVKGDPKDPTVQGTWAEAIANILLLKETPEDWRGAMLQHAEKHSREHVADQWEALLSRV